MTNTQLTTWYDITDAHKELREKLESVIDKFINTSDNIRMPIVIAPYGAGKTTLFKYLTWWCWSQKGVPAIYAHFSAIVDFIAAKGYNERRRIPEDQLHKIVEEFFDQKVKRLKGFIANKQWDDALKTLRDEFLNIKLTEDPLRHLNIDDKRLLNVLSRNFGVIFLDEIEEQYSRFKSLVQYETSPLRGLADAVYERRTKILVFIAYGPSTIAAETISKATSWRVEEHTIPVVDSKYLHELLEWVDVLQRLLSRNPLIVRGVVNLLWWLSRGRPAWARKFAQSGFLFSLVETLSSKPLRNLSNELRELLEREVHKDGSVLSGELIEGVRPLDYESYRKQLSFLKLDDEKNLFTTLILLPTSMPQDLLSELCGLPTIPRSNWLFSSRELINVDAFAEVLSDIAGQILEKVIKVQTAGLLKRKIYWIVKVISEVSANQHNEVLLDKGYFRELLEVISAYAQELYMDDPEISDAIQKVNPDELCWRIEREKRDAIRSTETVNYAIAPCTLLQIFPSLMVTPLIGKAKIAEGKLLNCFAETLENPDRLFDLFEKMTELLSENTDIKNPPFIMFLPTKFLGKAHEIVSKIIVRVRLPSDYPYILLFLVGDISREEKDLEKSLNEELKGFIDLGLITIEHLPPRSGLFLLGLFYNLANQGPSFIEELDRPDQIVYSSYKRSLQRDYIPSSIMRIAQKNQEVNNRLGSTGSIKSLIDQIESIERNAHAEVGSKHAEQIISGAHCLEGLELLAKMVSSLRELYDMLEEWNERSAIKFNIDDIFKEIKQFVLTKGRFVSRVKEAVELFNKALSESDILKCCCRALEILLTEKIKEGAGIDQSLEIVRSYANYINVLTEKGYFTRMLNSYIMCNVLNRLDEKAKMSVYFNAKQSIITFKSQYDNILKVLGQEIESSLRQLKDTKICLEEIKESLGLKVDLNKYNLVRQLSNSEVFLLKCQDIMKTLKQLQYLKIENDVMFERMLLGERGILRRVLEGLDHFAKAIRSSCLDTLRSVYSTLNTILDIAKNYKELIEPLSKDLLNILNLEDKGDIDNLHKEVQALDEILNEIEGLKKDVNEKLRNIRNEITSRLDQLLKLSQEV